MFWCHLVLLGLQKKRNWFGWKEKKRRNVHLQCQEARMAVKKRVISTAPLPFLDKEEGARWCGALGKSRPRHCSCHSLLETNAVYWGKVQRDSTPPTSDYILLMLRLNTSNKNRKMSSGVQQYLDYSGPRSMLVLGLSNGVTMNVRLGFGLARRGASHPVLRGGSHLAPEWLTAGCTVGG